ncbi:delta-lactam-biosynthetic de-N-acetylase [Clostridium isatidis]|uniref:Delta-lactam-biosynthetic de-N-acetylase n=1 Tax=Clostridium isatidis TaxID=182773 RepID=A0A343JAT8_9CLOT|nr:delta-lactam-biosynthetic de-N-acetylase [Clostridium isatidis]ASW42646.1 delta-lactam-biosynthetic de-N-acetylase [Clostridium isatidis]
MKKFLLFILLSLVFLLTLSNISHAFSLITDDTELNWYFVNRESGKTPEAPKESIDFLREYDAYYVGDTDSKVLYLTFDQGYENGNTNKILDILKEEKVPAAFFVVKPYIKTEKNIVKRMVEEGHLVCNHSSHHPSMATILDNEKFSKEFTEVEEEFKTLTGIDMPKYFRPPMGKYSKNSLKKTKALGYKTIFWSFAYKDWLVDNQPKEDYAIKKILNGVHPGAIILLHSVSDTNTKILKTVITELRKEGYEFKSLKDLPE